MVGLYTVESPYNEHLKYLKFFSALSARNEYMLLKNITCNKDNFHVECNLVKQGSTVFDLDRLLHNASKLRG